jgi:hypothetical protein
MASMGGSESYGFLIEYASLLSNANDKEITYVSIWLNKSI